MIEACVETGWVIATGSLGVVSEPLLNIQAFVGAGRTSARSSMRSGSRRSVFASESFAVFAARSVPQSFGCVSLSAAGTSDFAAADSAAAGVDPFEQPDAPTATRRPTETTAT